jgi:SNF2 family DNA or RNA helicase
MDMTNSIISRAHRQLLVPLTDSIKALWPQTKTLEHEGIVYAVLPHDPHMQIALRAVGLEIPSPILYHYGWDSADGKKPFEIQKATAAVATSNQRSYILNDLGTGKTRASIWAWHYLHQTGMAKKLLVVAPLSTLKFTWLREFSLMLPNCKAVVLHGARQKRLDLLDTDADIFIINHDGLKTVANQIFERTDIDTLIIDELAVYRNNSQRSKLMREFAKRFVWVMGLTGRPMPTAVTDVWAQAKILTPHRVPKFFRHAKTMLMTQVSQFKWVPKDGAIDTAFGWLQPSVRYSLDDVVELPEAISRTIEIELTSEQKAVYSRLSNQFAVLVKQQKITAANAGVALGKLLQVGAGYVYTTNPSYVELDSAPRKEKLLEFIEASEHKLIVFAPWRHLIGELSKLLDANEIEHAVIHGDITKREVIFNDFQNTPRYHVLLAHPQTVHHGLTLTSATTTIWYSPVTSLEVYEQAQARIRRVGQQHKQLFLHFKASPVEAHVYRMLKNKQRLQDAFLALLKEVTEENKN